MIHDAVRPDSGWKIYLYVSMFCCPVLLVGCLLGLLRLWHSGDWTDSITPICTFIASASILTKARSAYVNAQVTSESANLQESTRQSHRQAALNLPERVRTLADMGDVLGATKALKEISGVSLAEAKAIVEMYLSGESLSRDSSS